MGCSTLDTIAGNLGKCVVVRSWTAFIFDNVFQLPSFIIDSFGLFFLAI